MAPRSQLAPKIYDIHQDEYRPATQIDIDQFQQVVQAHVFLREGLQALLSAATKISSGKASVHRDITFAINNTILPKDAAR